MRDVQTVAEAVTIVDLIRNGTLTAEIAATLWVAMDRGLSLVVTAIPRLAGKTTTTNALLSLLPPEAPIHYLSGEEVEMDYLKKAATGGYLVVGEFSYGGMPGYIWGSPVRRVFDTMTAGYSLAAALHSSGLEETFDIICQGNRVSDEAASRIDLVLYIRRFGYYPGRFWRRLAEVHEVDYVRDGKPHGRLLYRWVEGEDRFERVETPRFLQDEATEVEARRARLEELASTGRRGPEDVARLVREYRKGLAS
ncbi:MAG: hypothetical protein HY672_04825 [Chloroflexi bacterium]|nr:hypothetical protein [Chloroflexota bacterium]